MKTNEELQNNVENAIKWEPLLSAPEIGVTIRDGVVTLKGTVDSYAKKWNRKLHLKDATIQTMITTGNIAESIINTATDIDASIIIIGSHIWRWFERILLGNFAEKVLQYTTLPLLIAPTKRHARAE
jgi:nucleotide-binding universal stress UspA family protein